MSNGGSYNPGTHAELIHQLVLEVKYSDAAKYLYAIRRVNMNEWLITVNHLLNLATTSRLLNVYATMIEVSKGSLIDEQAHKIPGLCHSLIGKRFDYDFCLIFIKESMARYCINR